MGAGKERYLNLLAWALGFGGLAAIAAVIAFSEVAPAAQGAGRFLFYVFLGVCAVLLLAAVLRRRTRHTTP